LTNAATTIKRRTKTAIKTKNPEVRYKPKANRLISSLSRDQLIHRKNRPSSRVLKETVSHKITGPRVTDLRSKTDRRERAGLRAKLNLKENQDHRVNQGHKERGNHREKAAAIITGAAGQTGIIITTINRPNLNETGFKYTLPGSIVFNNDACRFLYRS
jgi:hypothetical protein